MESTLPEVLAKVYEEGDYMQYVVEGHYMEKLPDGSLRESLSCEEAVAIGLAALRSRLEKVEALLARALGDGGIRTSVAAADDGEVRQAWTGVRSMLKETT